LFSEENKIKGINLYALFSQNCIESFI
jgi:hypothetical protein